MGFFLSKLLPQLIYPLGLGLLLQLIAIGGRKRRWALPLSITGWLVIAVPAMPVVSDALLRQLEDQAAALTPKTIPQADAVLVLGGGIRPAPAKGLGVEVNEAGDRLLCGVRLWKQGTAPVLITSGARVSFKPNDPIAAEAVLSQQLAEELGVPASAVLLNDQARTTAEEAQRINQLAADQGWKQLILVTSAFHMPRALASFQQQSELQIIPVACDYRLDPQSKDQAFSWQALLINVMPNSDSLKQTTQVLKEHLGLLVYKVRGQA
ncbi:YdcF family protein [Synechococcus sp. MIT S9452]|uniref:YdcF family protein n=1 Tax=Synechococcus sp. MIT S9452 TaxID=3082546 RepID=UPI0039A4224B